MEQSEEVVRNYTKFLKIFEREDFSSTRRGQKNASGWHWIALLLFSHTYVTYKIANGVCLYNRVAIKGCVFLRNFAFEMSVKFP